MSDRANGVKVSVQKHHTWRGKDYEPGDSYVVEGDQSQTTEQYLDTLRATGFAQPADDHSGQNVVNEVSGVDENDSRAKAAVQPLTTENFAKPVDAVPEKPAAAQVTSKPVAAKTAKAAKAPKAAKPAGKKK